MQLAVPIEALNGGCHSKRSDRLLAYTAAMKRLFLLRSSSFRPPQLRSLRW